MDWPVTEPSTHLYLVAEEVDRFQSQYQLCAHYDVETDWVAADRKDVLADEGVYGGFASPVRGGYGVSIDVLLLDFDAERYLSAIEIIGKRSTFVNADVSVPVTARKALMRLRDTPTRPDSLDVETEVDVYTNHERSVVCVNLPEFNQRSVWFAVGENCYVALDQGRLTAVLFYLNNAPCSAT